MLFRVSRRYPTNHLYMWNLKMISDLCWSKKLILHLCKSFYVNINGFWSLLHNIRKSVHSECFWPLLAYAVKVMSIYINFSQKTTVKTEKGQEVLKLSPLPKRAKRTYLAMEKDKEVIGYVVPVFRARWVMGGNPNMIVTHNQLNSNLGCDHFLFHCEKSLHELLLLLCVSASATMLFAVWSRPRTRRTPQRRGSTMWPWGTSLSGRPRRRWRSRLRRKPGQRTSESLQNELN